MKIYEFLTRLYDMPKDAKVVLNPYDYTEEEMRLFNLLTAPSVEEVFKVYVRISLRLSKIMEEDIKIFGDYDVKDIVFHDAHFKKDRFYEIKIYKENK